MRHGGGSFSDSWEGAEWMDVLIRISWKKKRAPSSNSSSEFRRTANPVGWLDGIKELQGGAFESEDPP